MSSIKTIKGRESHAKAIAGQGTVPKIVKVALGTGGTTGLTPKQLSGLETTLFAKEIEKVAILSFPKTTTARFTITIDAVADNLIGKNINEAGLIDVNGDYVALKTFTNKGMDPGTTIEFHYDVEY